METSRTKLERLIDEQSRKPAKLAQRLGVSRGTFSRWCSGERVIPPARVKELADLLGVHEDDILEDSVRQQKAGVA